MRKPVCYLLLLLLSVAMLHGEEDALPLRTKLTLDALTGGYFYPDRNDKATGYNESYTMHLTNHAQVSPLVSAYFDLGAEEERTQSRLTVHEAQVRWGAPDASQFSLVAMIGWRKYGHKPHGASLFLADPWYDRCTVEEIRLHGLRLVWHPRGRAFQFYADGGGNNTVSGLLDLGLKGDWGALQYDLYTLSTARDPDYNDPKAGVGGDLSWRTSRLCLIADYRFDRIFANVASEDVDKRIFFGEGRYALAGELGSRGTAVSIGGSGRYWSDSLWDEERRDWSAFAEWSVAGDSNSTLHPVFRGVNMLTRGYDFEGFRDVSCTIMPRFQAGPILLDIPITWTEPGIGDSFMTAALQFHASAEWSFVAR